MLEVCPIFCSQLIKAVADLWKLPPENLRLGPVGIIDNNGALLADYHALAWRLRLAGCELSVAHTYTPPVKTIDRPELVTSIAPEQKILPSLGYCAQAALVAVNASTGKVRILKIFAAQDVGKAINPDGISGQIRGALPWVLVGHLRNGSNWIKAGS